MLPLLTDLAARFPGEGPGAVALAEEVTAAPDDYDLRDWAPASAGEAKRAGDE